MRKGYCLGAVDFLFKPLVPQVLRAKVAVFAAHLLKPVDPDQLMTTLAGLIAPAS